MKKICNYIKKCGGILTSQTERSKYFILNSKVLRVSDHIGKNSDGNIQIIISKNNYLLYNRSNGEIIVATYEDIKCFIRNFIIINGETIAPENVERILNRVKPIVIEKQETKIMNYPIEFFTAQQQKQIASYITQNTKK